MGDWNRPRHLVLAVSSKIKVMCYPSELLGSLDGLDMLSRCVVKIDSVEGVTSSLTNTRMPCDHASHSGDSPDHDTNSHSGHE